MREAFKLTPGAQLVKGRNAAIHSPHVLSGFLRWHLRTWPLSRHRRIRSPRYGCPTSWKTGSALCSNRLTVRAKVADAALVAGLRAELLRPET